jgi:hypothetical protein
MSFCAFCAFCAFLWLSFFVADLEAALGPAGPITLFVDRCFDYFCDERFSKVAYFRVGTYGCRQGTTATLNREFVFMLHDFSGAAD